MDILLDQDFDLKIEDGDFVVGDDREQRLMLILDSNQGHWKQSPTVGVGIRGLLNGEMTPALKRRIQLQLEADGLKLSKLSFQEGELKVQLK